MSIRKDFEKAVKKYAGIEEALAPTAERFHAFAVANNFGGSSMETCSVFDYTGYAPEFDDYSLVLEENENGYPYFFVLPLNDGAEEMHFVVPFDYVDDADAWEKAYTEKQTADFTVAIDALKGAYPKFDTTFTEPTLDEIRKAYRVNYAEEGEFLCVKAKVAAARATVAHFLIRVSDKAVFNVGPHMLPMVAEGKIPAIGKVEDD